MDPSSVSATAVGGLGYAVGTGTFDATTGASWVREPGGTIFNQIDPSTPTQVGPDIAASIGGAVHGMEFSNGTLYTTNRGNLAFNIVDPVTGLVTVIANTTVQINGLAWDVATGTMYGSADFGDAIYTVDLGTAATTLLDTNAALNVIIRDMAIGADGNLYAVANRSSLLRIDKATGVATVLGDLVVTNQLTTLFLVGDTLAVPEPASLILMLAGLSLIGAMELRRSARSRKRFSFEKWANLHGAS